MNIREASLLWRLRGGLYHAAVERGEFPPPARDDAVAGVGEAGINAENDHRHVILRWLPDACIATSTPPTKA